MKRKIALSILACTLFSSAYADLGNGCADFHIQISNLTNDACVLASQSVAHGNLITPPPLSLMPNDSKRFDMTQTYSYGPAIVLTYQCGAETISFSSHQKLCVLEAGSISGELLSPLPVNITAGYTALSGSYYWKRSGSINWKIEKLN